MDNKNEQRDQKNAARPSGSQSESRAQHGTAYTGIDPNMPPFNQLGDAIINQETAQGALGLVATKCKSAGLPLEKANSTLQDAYQWSGAGDEQGRQGSSSSR